jgi:DNA-binding NarL/FixJ family response regulator
MPDDRAIRVLIVDDQAMIRAGFAALLGAQDGITVVGDAADGADASEAVYRTKPDIVLMDIRMPRLDGIEATRRILAMPGDTHPRIIILTTFDLDDYVYAALRAGASGFLLKDATAAELTHAVRVIAAGDALLSPSVTRTLIADYARRPAPSTPDDVRLNALTDREREVLSLVARGMSNAEIAGDLVLSEQTVKTHISRIFTKLDLHDRAQAVVFAYESGLVRPGG